MDGTIGVSTWGGLSPEFLNKEFQQSMRSSFLANTPFPHVVMKNVYDAAALRRVREEIIQYLKADYKETDIFKVYQTGAYRPSGMHC